MHQLLNIHYTTFNIGQYNLSYLSTFILHTHIHIYIYSMYFTSTRPANLHSTRHKLALKWIENWVTTSAMELLLCNPGLSSVFNTDFSMRWEEWLKDSLTFEEICFLYLLNLSILIQKWKLPSMVALTTPGLHNMYILYAQYTTDVRNLQKKVNSFSNTQLSLTSTRWYWLKPWIFFTFITTLVQREEQMIKTNHDL